MQTQQSALCYFLINVNEESVYNLKKEEVGGDPVACHMEVYLLVDSRKMSNQYNCSKTLGLHFCID